MFTELYPNLKANYNYANFEVIVETLDKHFKSLFNLQVLDNEMKSGRKNGSYVAFFALIMPQLEHLYTVEEVMSQLSEILQNDADVRKCFLAKLIFVPPLDGQPSTQLGFIEKTATGVVKVAEPVTYLDMLRLTQFLPEMSRAPYSSKGIAVLNLNTMQPGDAAAFKKKNHALMVNFNRDVRGTPKWGVVDLRDPADIEVYCETPLLEAEKKELEERLDFEFKEVSPGKSDSLASTGYTAIAWLDQHITKAWNFDISSDFNALLQEYAFMQFRGDAQGVRFAFVGDEYNQYFTQALKAINDVYYPSFDLPGSSKRWGGAGVLTRLVSFTILGKIENEAIPLNDLSKVIEVVGGQRITKEKFNEYVNLAYRSTIPRFDNTLTIFGNPKILQEDDNLITLTIPDNIDKDELNEAHEEACAVSNTSAHWFSKLKRVESSAQKALETPVTKIKKWEESAATAMVLTMFRAKAKKRELAIHLPTKFQLNREEQQFISSLIQDNPYVTELSINDNVSLHETRSELLPVFARNRWLAANGYLPPFFDNYWQRSAKYWLIHLNQHTNILADKHEHELFKRCVREMGIKGLDALLNLLGDETQREVIESIYGKNKPAFYAATLSKEVDQYLTKLIEHLEAQAYFPYSELGISYEVGRDQKYIELIEKINRLDQFEQFTLADGLNNPIALKSLLFKLAERAHAHQWVGLIVIPELEDKNKVGSDHRELLTVYKNLNNIILHNRHVQASAKLVAQIKLTSDFSEPSTENVSSSSSSSSSSKNETLTAAIIDEAFQVLNNKKAGPWPLKRGGAIQLQLQQQQEIQQTRQLQKEQQKVLTTVLEEVIIGEQVTYGNIDALLSDYFDKFAAENSVNEQSAALREDGESLLQGFFHTWINASPHVAAPEVIHSMTLDAAKMLIRKHGRVSSGLNLENLPKGFYTQRAKNGSLILCYNPEVGFVNGTNPFTLELTNDVPHAEAWEGDFRQFDIAKYLKSLPALGNTDFHQLALFAKLQPVLSHQADFAAFCAANPLVRARIDEADGFSWMNLIGIKGEKKITAKITNNWLVFLQAWQYEGMEGVNKFIALPNEYLSLNLQEAYAILFKNQSPQIQEWVASTVLSDNHLRALGQVYYRYGDDALALLLAKLRQIDKVLGREFFDTFNEQILSRSENYDCFISERFFTAMDDMIATLHLHHANNIRQAWLEISKKHLQVLAWENIETLWKAFDYFLAELKELGLELKGDEFNAIKPENMLVCLDRVLETLKRLPSQDQKVAFMRHLSQFDLTYGGVHYAIQHEGFKYFDDDLQLHDFTLGTPTYGPNLSEMYSWNHDESIINIKRTLASRSQFGHDDYRFLSEQLQGDNNAKDALMWLLFTQFDARQIDAVFTDIQAVDGQFKALIASHLHQVAYLLGYPHVAVSLEAILQVAKISVFGNRLEQLLQKFPYGTALEAMSILWQTKRWSELDNLLTLLDEPLVKNANYPDYLFRDGYKLATLFGSHDTRNLQVFYALTASLKPIVKSELNLLIRQILSIDYETSNLSTLQDAQNWQNLLHCIQLMTANPATAAEFRIALIGQFNARGINFKYSRSGEFRALKDADEDRPPELGFFVDHQARLWNFMLAHIVVPVNDEAKETLQPIIRFLKKMQVNRTYLNEIEPLLATLEQTANGTFWTASYFYQMLKTLQPEDDQVSFPIPILKVMLKDVELAAKEIDSVEKDFPEALITPIQGILKNTIFNRSEQSLLTELALKEYGFKKSNPLLADIINILSPATRELTRDYALKILVGSKDINELENRIEKLRWLLEHAVNQEVVSLHWTKSTALWLKALAADQREEALFAKIRNSLVASPEKQTLILHIIAWSSLHAGLRDHDTYEYELRRKAPKLVERLALLTEADLIKLALCYPRQPSPGANDILRLLKKKDAKKLSLDTCIDDFLRHPYLEPRRDFQFVTQTREADLQRMFAETRITNGHEKTPIPPENAARLSLIFSTLKQLEEGTLLIEGLNRPVEYLSQAQLAQAFNRLSLKAASEPQNDRLRAEIWALLFEALARTTRKYPHLAQQFAIIANEVCIDSNSRFLQLETGEGKSHFVALRAAKHAGMGKIIDICTAKPYLAQRDLNDYQDLFSYLNLTSSYIHPKSTREAYINAKIHYSTMGDLSLFLDEQSFHGNVIEIDKRHRVALFDEFDFIRYEEGHKTEYNYARPTGKTPKQLTWLYQAINQFYLDNQSNIRDNNNQISVNTIQNLAEYLYKNAGDDEEKQNLVIALLRDPLQLVRWLQSADEASSLVMGEGFTVREENIEVGDTTYPLKEIIPLSSDNQKMTGSTFSAGVQQLLAILLNKEAKRLGKPQNYHIHPESNIISSQVASERMKELWGSWEGFSGTISASQAQTLHTQEGTQVLHVSTNQLGLRNWHAPAFYKNEDARLQALVKQIHQCLSRRQSILFSCKNDNQVIQLQEKLKKLLPAEEFANLIFYTNEDELSPRELLDSKREKELWQGGKKQQAIGLLASGFGRGDNVGVEAVFLFNANNVNDLLQKGGRTARNGEEGEVFQFYLTEELEKEEKQWLQTLKNSKGINLSNLTAILNTVEGNNADEKTFARVMLLREYAFNLQNMANLGFHESLAQFSSWSMSLMGKFNDPALSFEFSTRITAKMKNIEKQWVDISSNVDSTSEEKIKEIDAVLNIAADSLWDDCTATLRGKVAEVQPFKLREARAGKLEMALEKKVANTQSGNDLAIVATRLASLAVDMTNEELAHRIPQMIKQLATHEASLNVFAKQIADCKSVIEFVNLLELAVTQTFNSSKLIHRLKTESSKEVKMECLLNNVSSSLKVAFLDAIDLLTPNLAEELIRSLSKKNVLSEEERIEQIMPLMNYLKTFNVTLQNQWGLDYIQNLDKLLFKSSPTILAIKLAAKPISYHHNESLWKITTTYSLEQNWLQTMQLLQEAISNEPEPR